ncbi:MAG TPA: DinB family protein [Longimicrobium sp.]|nr:DinB family protein [Longimicrobium sp.]
MEITSAESFLGYFESVRGRTRRVVERIPPEKLEWTYQEGAFTLGDQVRHIAATERWMFGENIQGRPSRYPGHGAHLADGFGAVVAYLDRMHAETVEVIRALSPEDLARPAVTPAGTPITTWKWLRAMVEHEIHHRAHIYMMLQMLRVPTPPLYGLTSEEVFAHSVHE